MPIDTCGTKFIFESQPIPKMELVESQPTIKGKL